MTYSTPYTLACERLKEARLILHGAVLWPAALERQHVHHDAAHPRQPVQVAKGLELLLEELRVDIDILPDMLRGAEVRHQVAAAQERAV